MLAQKLLTAGKAEEPVYIEDVFSTYLYTGNGSTQTITNGIDLSTKGGMVWLKNRSVGTGIGNELYNTNVGAGNFLSSNNTNANTNTTAGGTTYGLSSFNSNGFTVNDNWSGENTNGQNIASWTFRKQPKFFDIVTFTGNGATTARAISHSLGSVPGAMIVIPVSTTGDRKVYHRVLGETKQLKLQLTDASANTPCWGNTAPTATDFYVAFNETNQNGQTYVAYLFAHNAGGFGLTGTDNVISCGSFTTDGSGNATVNLGYEPQWVLYKAVSAGTNESWELHDTMRGYSQSGYQRLQPNTSGAEITISGNYEFPTATGFSVVNGGLLASTTFIYIAIRRGPMKVPTSGTSVFSPVTYTGDGTTARDFTNFGMLPDFVMLKQRNGTEPNSVIDRLRGGGNYLVSSATQAESAYPVLSFDSMNGVNDLDSYFNASGATWVFEAFRRAPNFFDVVCYTGTGSTTTFNHNLGAVPELMIFKQRSGTGYWPVYDSTSGPTKISVLNAIGGSSVSSTAFNNTAPTSTVFTVGTLAQINTSAQKYVAYLFASCPGVSKVGSYIGNGSTQTINCGFAGGARFVLIKCISGSTGWYVYDTARGMTISTDPFLWLQSTDAETDAPGSVTTVTTGFAVDYNAEPGVNLSGYTYIYLAIA